MDANCSTEKMQNVKEAIVATKVNEPEHIKQLRKELKDALRQEAKTKDKARNRLDRHAAKWSKICSTLYSEDEAAVRGRIDKLVSEFREDFIENEGLEAARIAVAERQQRSERAKEGARKRADRAKQKQEAPKGVSAVDTSSVELSSDEMAEEQARAIEAHLQSSGYRLEQQQGGFQNWGYGSE